MWRPVLAALVLAAASCAPADDASAAGPGATGRSADRPTGEPTGDSTGGTAAGSTGAPAPEGTAGDPDAEGAGAAPPRPDVLSEAPARTKLGRIRSAVLESEVVFVGGESQPHRLTLTCAFPERSRMELAGPGGAQVRYQLGGRVWALDRGGAASPGSRELSGPDRSAVALDLALRRALFFWPDEREFVGGGRTLSAQVDDLGVLVATLEDGGARPAEMRAVASDGSVVGRVAVDGWFEQGGREWPRRLRLLDGDAVVWHETIEEVDADWFVGDPFFVPPDVLVTAKGSAIAGARAVELPGRSEARLPLEAGLGLSTAIDRAVAAWSDARDEAGLDLAPHVEVVVDRRGAPKGIVLTADGARGGAAGVPWRAAEPTTAWRIPAPGRPGMDYETASGKVATAATAGGDGPVELRHRVTPGASSRDTEPADPPGEWILALAR